MLPFYPEKYRKCRMCLKTLNEEDRSLFDDNMYLLTKFQKSFNPKKIHNFMFEDKKNLACVCDSCEDRLHYYYKLSHVARKNIRMFIENKECLRYRCLMCLKGLNLLDDQQTVVSIFKDNDYALAKIYGKCFHIREIHLLLEVKDSDKLCESCYYKLMEFHAMRITVKTYDNDYFGNPFIE